MTYSEDELDLRPYIRSLLDHWKQIVLIVLLAALVGLAFSILQPRKYESVATAIVTRSQLQLSLADQFTTINEARDSRSRMDAFLAIATSDGIAEEVFQLVEDRLPLGANRDDLRGSVEIADEGDAILVSAAAEDPALAAEIANIWTEVATGAINSAYSGNQPLVEIQGQLADSRSAYENAQTELETFIAENNTKVLENQIDANERLLVNLADDQVTLFEVYDGRWHAMNRLLLEAESLKALLEDGSESGAGKIGDAIAVIYARAKATGILDPNIQDQRILDQVSSQETIPGQELPNTEIIENRITSPVLNIDFQLSASEVITSGVESYPDDIDAVITLATEERSRIEELMNELGMVFVEGEQRELTDRVATQLRRLRTELERETARELQLTSDRDLAWDTYQALLKKETEILTTEGTSSAVVLASPALPSQQPVSRGTVLNIAILGLLGLLLALVWIIASAWWRSANSIDENSAPGTAAIDQSVSSDSLD